MTKKDLNIYIKAKLKHTQTDVKTQISDIQKTVDELNKTIKIGTKLNYTKTQLETSISEMQKVINGIGNLKIDTDLNKITQAQVNQLIDDAKKLAGGKVKIDVELNPVNNSKNGSKTTADTSKVHDQMADSAKKASQESSKAMNDYQKQIEKATKTLQELRREQEMHKKNAKDTWTDNSIWGKLKKDNVRLPSKKEDSESYDKIQKNGVKDTREIFKPRTDKNAKPLDQWLKEQKMSLDEFMKQTKGGYNFKITGEFDDEDIKQDIKAYKDVQKQIGLINKELEKYNQLQKGSSIGDIAKKEMDEDRKKNTGNNQKPVKSERIYKDDKEYVGSTNTYKDTKTGTLKIEKQNSTGEITETRVINEYQKIEDTMAKMGLEATKMSQRTQDAFRKAFDLGMNSKFKNEMDGLQSSLERLGETSERADLDRYQKQLIIIEGKIKEEEEAIKKLNKSHLEEEKIIKKKAELYQKLERAMRQALTSGTIGTNGIDIEKARKAVDVINPKQTKNPANLQAIAEADTLVSDAKFKTAMSSLAERDKKALSEAQKDMQIATQKWSRAILNEYDKIRKYNLGKGMEEQLNEISKKMQNTLNNTKLTPKDKGVFQSELDDFKNEVSKQVKQVKGVENYKKNLEKEGEKLKDRKVATPTEEKKISKIVDKVGKATTKSQLDDLNSQLKEVSNNLSLDEGKAKLLKTLEKIGREGNLTKKTLEGLTSKVNTTTAIKDLDNLAERIDKVNYKAKFLKKIGEQEEIFKDLKQMKDKGVIDLSDGQLKNIEKSINKAKSPSGEQSASVYKDVRKQIKDAQGSIKGRESIKVKINALKLNANDIIDEGTIKALEFRLGKITKNSTLKALAKDVDGLGKKVEQVRLGEVMAKDTVKMNQWRDSLKADIKKITDSGKDMTGEFKEYENVLDKIGKSEDFSYIQKKVTAVTKEIEKETKAIKDQQAMYEKLFATIKQNERKALQSERDNLAKQKANSRTAIVGNDNLNDDQKKQLRQSLVSATTPTQVKSVNDDKAEFENYNKKKKELEDLIALSETKRQIDKESAKELRDKAGKAGSTKELQEQIDGIRKQKVATDEQIKKEKELRAISKKRIEERKELLKLLNSEKISQEQFNKLNSKLNGVKNTSQLNSYKDSYNATVPKGAQAQIEADKKLDENKKKLVQTAKQLYLQNKITEEQYQKYARSVGKQKSQDGLDKSSAQINDIKNYNSSVDSQQKALEKMRREGQITEEQMNSLSKELKELSNTGKIDFNTEDARRKLAELETKAKNVREGNKNGTQAEPITFSEGLGNNRDLNSVGNRDLQRVFASNEVLNGMRVIDSQINSTTGTFTARLRESETRVRTVTGEIDRMTGHMRVLGQATRQTFNLSLIEQFKIALQRVPVWMAAMTVFYGTIRSIEAMKDVIVETDTQMTELKRVMDEDTNFNNMLKESISLSKELGNNLTDVNKSMIGFARQGFNEQEVLDMTKTAIVTSNVSELTADEAMNNLTAIMTQFNIEASKSITIIDKLNEVDNNFNITTKDLSDALSKAGATAQTFGVDIDTMIGHVTAIGMATKESGSVIGNSLKTIYSRLTTMPGAVSALDKVGISIKDMYGETKSSAVIFDEMAQKWDTLSKSEQQNLAVKTAGTHQLSRMLALMNNYDVAMEAKETSQTSEGSADRENEKYMQSLQAQINQLSVMWKEFALAVGDSFLTDAFKSVLFVLSDLAQMGTKLADMGVLLPGIFGLIGIALNTRLTPAVANVVTAFNTASISAIRYGAELVRTASYGFVASASQRAFATSVTATKIALNLLQIGLIKAGVAIKTFSVFLATSLAPMAVFAGIGIAISALTKKYSEAREEEKRIMETKKELVDSYKKEGKEIDKLVEQYAVLNKKVKDGSKSENDEEYLNIQNELAELMPSLVDHIDEKGNAHLRSADAIKQEVSQLKELSKLEAGSFLDSYMDNVDEIDKKIKKQKKKKVEEGKSIKWKEDYDFWDYLVPFRQPYEKVKELTPDDMANNMYRDMEIEALTTQKVGLFKQLTDEYAEFIGMRDELTDSQSKAIDTYIEENKKLLETKEGYDELESTVKRYVQVSTLATSIAGPDVIDQDTINDIVENPAKNLEKMELMKKIQEQMKKGFTDWDSGNWEKELGEKFGTTIGQQIMKNLKGEIEKEPVEIVAKTIGEYNASDSISELYGMRNNDEIAFARELIATYELLAKQTELTTAEQIELDSVLQSLTDTYGEFVNGKEVNIEGLKQEMKSTETIQEAFKKMVSGELELDAERTLTKALEAQRRIATLQAEAEAQKKLYESLFNQGIFKEGSEEAQKYSEILAQVEEEKKNLAETTDLLASLMSEEESEAVKEQKKLIEKLNIEMSILNDLKDNYVEGSKERLNVMKQEAELIKLQMQAILDLNDAMLANESVSDSLSTGSVVSGGSDASSAGASLTGSTKSVSVSGTKDFVTKLQKYAQTASNQTDIPVEVILSQWGLETGWGSSKAFKNGLNLAGIKSNSKGSQFANGAYAGYNTLEASVNDWIRNMQRDIYAGVRNATGVEGSIQALHKSPWAEDKTYDKKLLGALDEVKKYISTSTATVETVYKNGQSQGKVDNLLKTNTVPTTIWDYYKQFNEVHPQGTYDPSGKTIGRQHKGYDFNLNGDRDLGKAVLAIAQGSIRSAGYDKSAGNYVTVKHLDGTISKYYHLLENMSGKLKVGQAVNAGDNIGKIGNTGQSSGAHLHMEIEVNDANGKKTTVDPIKYLQNNVTSAVQLGVDNGLTTGISNVADIDWDNITKYENLTPENMRELLTLKGQLENLVSEEARNNIQMIQNEFDKILYDVSLSKERATGASLEVQSKEIDFQMAKQKDLNKLYKEAINTLEQQKNMPSAVTGLALTPAQKALYQAQIDELNKGLLEINNTLNELSSSKAELEIRNFTNAFDDLNEAIELAQLRMEGLLVGSAEWRKEIEEIMKVTYSQIRLLEQQKLAMENIVKSGVLNAEDQLQMLEDIEDITKQILSAQNSLSATRMDKAKGELEEYKWELEQVETQISLSSSVQSMYEDGTKEFNVELERQSELIKKKIGILERERVATARLITTGNLTVAQQRELQRELASINQAIMQSQAEVVAFQKQLEKQVTDLADRAKDKALEILDEEMEAKRDALEKQKENALEAIEDELEALQKAHDKKMDMYDDEIKKINNIADAKIKQINNDSRDRDHDDTLAELQKEKAKLEKELQDWANVDNSEGRQKRKELAESIAKVDKEIEDENYDYRKELAIESVEDLRDLQLEEVEDKKKAQEAQLKEMQERLDKEKEALEKHYKELAEADEKYFKEEKQRIIDEHLKATEEGVKSVIEFIEKNGDRIGDELQKELIDKLVLAQQHLESLQNAFDKLSFSDINDKLNPNFDLDSLADRTGLSNADLKLLQAKYMTEYQGKHDEAHLLADQARKEGSTIDPNKNKSFQDILNSLSKQEQALVNAFVKGESTQTKLSQADLDLMRAKYMTEYGGQSEQAYALAREARANGSTIDPYVTRGYDEILAMYDKETQGIINAYAKGLNSQTKLIDADFQLLKAKYMVDIEKKNGKDSGAYDLAREARNNGSRLDQNNTQGFNDIMATLDKTTQNLVKEYINGTKTITEVVKNNNVTNEQVKVPIKNALTKADLDLIKAKYMVDVLKVKDNTEAYALAKQARENGATIDPGKDRSFQEIMKTLDDNSKEQVQAILDGKPIEKITNSNNKVSTENKTTNTQTINNNTTINNKNSTATSGQNAFGSGTTTTPKPPSNSTGSSNSGSGLLGSTGNVTGGLFQSGSNDKVLSGWDLLNKIVKADTGTYTGDQEGLLYVHKKELVLSENDTANTLDIVKQASSLGSVLSSIGRMSFGGATQSEQDAKIAEVKIDVNIEKVEGGKEGFDSLMKQINNNLKGKGVSFNL